MYLVHQSASLYYLSLIARTKTDLLVLPHKRNSCAVMWVSGKMIQGHCLIKTDVSQYKKVSPEQRQPWNREQTKKPKIMPVSVSKRGLHANLEIV